VGAITLLTDFGIKDVYVGVMHGVILRINPAATIVDLCHDVPPQDVRSAAFVLSSAYPYFHEDTIHVIVVDPGVGSERRAIAMRTAHGTFVAPDNGVLTYVLGRESLLEMVHLTNSKYWLSPLSDTFHGRDVFAPVAAHLSLGVPLSEFGPALRQPERFEIPEPRLRSNGTIVGQVLYIDGFGNLITNIPGERLPRAGALKVRIAGQNVAGPLKTYAEVRDGQLLALVDSSGHLEIAVRNGNAAGTLRVACGAEVAVTPVGREGQKG
jgi:S-adenosylmethionine hydrolase